MSKNTAPVQKGRFFIVNDVDRPCEELIAERRGNKLVYIKDKNWPAMIVTKWTVSVEDFGIKLTESGGWLHGEKIGPSASRYYDGRIRGWQWEPRFKIKLEEKK